MSSKNIFPLDRPDILLVITTATTGFGHVRVTQALHQALPPGTTATIIGLNDSSLSRIHAITSRHVILRWIMELFQTQPLLEEIFTRAYRRFLAHYSQKTYNQLARLISEQETHPKTVVFVCTHFSLAHQISAVKTRLESQFSLKIILAVIVTDDTLQKIWAVPGADYTFVPSPTTQKLVSSYLKKLTSHPPEVIVSPYPLAPSLNLPLTPAEFTSRCLQVDPQNPEPTRLIIPISGAAVQMSYFKDLISHLINYDPWILITVISRSSPVTADFLTFCRHTPRVEVMAHAHDPTVVDLYEKAYSGNVFSLEITKPSEQAFKGIIPPRHRGGSLLLFSDPVGDQEDDNLNFLYRHQLLPNPQDESVLESLYSGEVTTVPQEFLDHASRWRGLRLPVGSGKKAAEAILTLRSLGIFHSMMNFSSYLPHSELRGDGATLFWHTLSRLIFSRVT